ncbi:undecaprenyldiphospho-muramoylpentapeptide beta-N- acetylglucosaminyltransferase [Neoasaia chiangmaiensis NBRC 101099]|uniref:UDP-N-acetylglucosamine--N-acetylmuramyl-(pentapeptide) pyrophosphoryl-undecaprenol N-acetylglucosamine transferase n=1 Tax=Neoasaia chiangmaiensis TaxID=320497 RepID=A0A1U9KSS7_9PROT|nr:undecaprenyldiphospho-muramoylpentapeptide beta-N-acetylglucosaminyltransferase [Neoasaia chiangmaiensis]AQS88891.1 UDP-N-acetylglucosamine--N-acetylmuramyl-(pentapeptide) pyrophosphoryl-undecaprenol N-acetylglucosamine transferase [Neoasaia chiangmaiensis]GBR40474.1 undecaprenyldiphospho-muramoylpentapeptide beta-N- acetylglucosaminyltransferase [Neoasaia chiangmaiensis NBRC 101099]GEN13882.1 UDP-N-acetylglucosamine--N-acetylmuramyl-(pentapeptide) pyrophosphoryl-undecaprenol N-acetylglucosam
MKRRIVIAAGGTGGHFFPAEALATILAARGHDIVLMTDRRHGRREHGIFADRPQYILEGAGIAGRGLMRKLRGGLALFAGIRAARRLLNDIEADVVVGFGGYPSVPPILGAWLRSKRRRPAIVIHEGNAVLGQANALLARTADVIATSYPVVSKLPRHARTSLTGMPVRPGIEALADAPYAAPAEAIHLLVWGGSLGARVFADIVPAALVALPIGFRSRLHVTQQARAEDVDRVRAAYDGAGIAATIQPFFEAVPKLLQDAHLVIGRAGGSSIAELTIAGRPSILVPLPIAASDEQGANAAELARIGGAWLIRQPAFTVEALLAQLQALLADPAQLAVAAAAARSLAKPHSAELLADLVESTQPVYAAPAAISSSSKTL